MVEWSKKTNLYVGADTLVNNVTLTGKDGSLLLWEILNGLL